MSIQPSQVNVENCPAIEIQNERVIAYMEVDGTSGGNTTIYSVPTNRELIITRIVVRGNSVVGAPATDAEVSFGTNNPNFDNIFPDTFLTGLSDTNGYHFISTGISERAFTGENVTIRVETSATYTTYDMGIYVIGYLIEV